MVLLKVVRGGGWRGNPRNLRAPDRIGVPPEGRSYDVGFRCAVRPQDSKK